MMKDVQKLKGMVTVTVRDEKGEIKKIPNNFIRRLLGLPEKKMVFRHHNTITSQGDGLIADWMLGNPTQTKVDSTNGYMILGTGWTGSSTKANTGVNTAAGTYTKLDTGFPKTSGAFGSTGQNIVLYRTSFEAGTLNINGINEVALMNGNTAAAKCLAYAQITPSVNVTYADTLQIDWQITVSGS